MIDIDIDFGDLDDELNRAITETQQEAALLLASIGEEYIIESKETGSYQDDTGNLRGANSYGVYLNGNLLYGSFGRSDTKRFFDSVKDNDGLQLICGNGMEYCSYVEGKGFVVVSSGFIKVMNRVYQVFG
ncbi:MAG: hypothetical protein PHE09_10245 [Oscillospiraceae bacterium]|nr:hypothetical protein [Oscillospiraceae bacterium]